jgi:hypothetical protein
VLVEDVGPMAPAGMLIFIGLAAVGALWYSPRVLANTLNRAPRVGANLNNDDSGCHGDDDSLLVLPRISA